MQTREQVFRDIIEVISKNEDLVPRKKITELTPESKLSDDCGYDSLALMSLIYELQENYPEMGEAIIATAKTFNDLIDEAINA